MTISSDFLSEIPAAVRFIRTHADDSIKGLWPSTSQSNAVSFRHKIDSQ